MADLVKFYEGGVTLTEVEAMPLSKIFLLQREAVRINKEIENSVKT